MIGSPDLLAFTGTDGFGEEEEEEDEQATLPEELSVPLVPPAHPWTTAAQFHRDFILVAEFSEQVGPKPVLTIPDDPRVIGLFDLNHFSVRLMSVDYQASGPGPVSPSSPGPRLNFSEDSEVILGDSAHDAFAYVHHMTLYDLEARGMVRPFCMAYVCSDQAKLTENFAELSASFSQASDSLKTGNRQAFSLELQRKLQELECNFLTLQQEAKRPNVESGLSKEEELDAARLSISTHRDLLRQVTSYPNRKLKQPDFLPYDPADSLADAAAFLPPEPCYVFPSSSPSSSPSSGSEKHLKPLQELCNPYFLSLTKEQLATAERRLRGDGSALRTARLAAALSRSYPAVNFLFELSCPDDADEGAGEGEGAEAEQQQQQPASFSSCVEELPIKMEAAAATSDPCAEMAGSVSSSDSIEVLGTERSYRTQQLSAGSDSRETAGGTWDGRRVPADGGARRGRAYARRANSEDSIEVLSTTESIFPDDLTAISEEEAEQQQQESERNELLREEVARLRKLPSPASGEVPPEEEEQLVEGETPAAMTEAASDSEVVVNQPVPDLQVNFTPLLMPSEADVWPPSRAPLRMLSLDEVSEATSSSDPPSLQQPHGSCDPKRRRRAGVRALRFLRRNSFSQHAVFCLLSGQPLVVLGTDESVVRKLVEALSLFLPGPGPDGSAVTPCLTTPLQLTDLLAWRLIGMHRSPSTSAALLHSLTRYSRYVALLDLDQKTLRSPAYSGSLVGRLANPYANIRHGSTYLLHLESALTALSGQALLYTFSPALQPGAGPGDEFLLRRGLCGSRDDLSVMHFLSDLIKQRHAGRGPPSLRFSYCSVQLHRNTYVP